MTVINLPPLTGFWSARGTYFGPATPDKITYLYITERGFFYVADDKKKITQRIQERDDRDSLVYAGVCPEHISIILGDMLENLGFLFKLSPPDGQ